MIVTIQGWFSEKLPFALFVLALAFLIFVLGAMVTVADLFPSRHVRNAYTAGTALYDKYTRQSDPLASDLWARARTDRRGVTVHDPTRAHDGYTLYTSGDAARAVMIAMDGRVVHEWRRPFSDVWDDTAAVRSPVPDSQTYFRKAHVFPDGDLLAIYIGVGDSPYGYGMVRLDSSSNVVWKNLDRFHHDFSVADDGRIYALTHDYRSEPLADLDHIEPPVLEDYLVILSPEGEIRKKISLLDALNRSDFRSYLWLVAYYSLQDPLHTNSVKVLDHADAQRLGARVPAAAAGQVLLSFRELAGGSVALLDPDQEKIVWIARGSWLAQHDAQVTEDGNILVFDNRGHFGPGGGSRVLEFDPASGGVEWVYAGDAERPLDSAIRSAQQQLANGNILITESNGGRLVEVTRDGEIVWEFINPVRAGKNDELVSVVSWGRRIEPGALTADFRRQFSEQIASREVSTR